MKTLYLCPFKTASQSIHDWLSHSDLENVTGHHHVTFHELDQYDKNYRFKIMSIRHPRTRIPSMFYFCKKSKSNFVNDKTTFAEFIDLQKETYYYNVDISRPLSCFCPYVDFVIKFESLLDDINRLSETLNCTCPTLRHINHGNNPSYNELWTPELEKKSRDLYRGDLEIFGYEWEI